MTPMPDAHELLVPRAVERTGGRCQVSHFPFECNEKRNMGDLTLALWWQRWVMCQSWPHRKWRLARGMAFTPLERRFCPQ